MAESSGEHEGSGRTRLDNIAQMAIVSNFNHLFFNDTTQMYRNSKQN